MNITYRLLSTLTFIIMISFFGFGANKAEEEPDFAYPRTVASGAEAALRLADANSNAAEASAQRMRAALELLEAQRRVNPDTVFGQPAFVALLTERTANFAPGRAMFTLLEARVLNTIYQDDRYRYDQVSAPLLPLPQKVEQWSGEQFRSRIKALIAEAVDIAARQEQSLGLYGSSLVSSELGYRYVPTVYDFVAYRGTELLNDIDLRAASDSLKAAALAHAVPQSPAFFFWTAAQPGFSTDALGIYRRYADIEDARYLLMKHDNGFYVEPEESSLAGEKELADALAESLRRFPGWLGNNSLKLDYDRLTNPSMDVSIDNMVGCGTGIKVTGEYCWADKVKVDVYFTDTPRGDNESEESFLARAARLMTYSKTTDASSRQHGKIEFTVSPIESHGYLSLKCVLNDTIASRGSAQAEVMPVMAFGIGSNRQQGIAAVDFVTGRPLRNVDVWENSYNRYSRNADRDSVRLGATGRNGALLFRPDYASSSRSRYLSLRYRNHNYDFGRRLAVSNPYVGRRGNTDKLQIITDRPLYHPGDSLEWAVVAVTYDSEGSGSTLAGNGTVEFYDANHSRVGSAVVTLDHMGRAHGAFAIPRGRLTGQWMLQFRLNDNRESCAVEVSDFRMPVFKVEITGIERDVPSAGAVRICGNATSYAGMALAGVDIKADITSGSRWLRYYEPLAQLGSVDTITDSAGNFTLDIPAGMLAEGNDYDNFAAEITATTAAGETAFAETRFTTGKPYSLACMKPRDQVNVDTPVQFLINAENLWGRNTPIEVEWQVMAADSAVVAQGSAVTGTPFNVDLSGIPAGKYSIMAQPSDTTLAKGAMFDNVFCAYSVRRNAVPSEFSFFVPETEATAGNSILVGINRDKAWIYAISTDRDGNVTVKVHEVRRGFSHIDVPGDAASLDLACVENGQVLSADIYIRENVTQALGVVAETFRDHLTPGQMETWRFRITDAAGIPAPGAAMVARMYNNALEALSPYDNFNAPAAFIPAFDRPFVNLDIIWLYRLENSARRILPISIADDYSLPDFRYIDMRRMFMPMLKMSRSAAVEANGVLENAYDAAVPEAVEEEAVATGGVEVSADSDGAETGTGSPQQPETPEYRPSEVLQAFFKPTLVSDADGNVDVVFTVPDANGAWIFQALVWNSKALSAIYEGTAISSKPIMVQPALPRFLRQGDKARLLTTVYNNTGSEAAVTTVTEIFDVATGEIIATATAADTIAAENSSIVAVDITAPTDAAAIGFRVRATDGTFADGEQTAIPILASAATVVESTEFYVNPNTAEPFETEIDMKPGFSHTLQYCDNPIWTVVKAMRGSSGGNTSISTSLASHIFSLLATGIVADANPSIAGVVEQWQNADSGSALTSMLSRNADLKLLMLKNTPWLQTAADESARMASLAALLDGDGRAADLEKAMGRLRAMQQGNGGFEWASWSTQPSPWATRTILTTFGLARSLGAELDDDTETMLRRALDYVCAEAVKPHHPDTDLTLALLAALYPDYGMPVGARGIVEATRRDIERNWRTHSTADKAWDIIILGADNRESRRIFASLQQYGVVRPGMGMCFPSVDDMRSYANIMQAYKLMGASTDELDAMRQWVIVQAQATDDLSACNPDYIIAALITSGTDWTRTAPVTNVTLGGEALRPDAVEAASGYFAMPLAGTGTRNLVVAGNGVTPAYGSVTAIGRQPAATVAERPGRDVAIRKRVLVNRDGEWVETDTLRLGERARVQLTLTAGRDMEYVAIVDERPAAFAPVEQMPGYVYSAGLAFYRVNADAETDIFIGYLPAGTYHIQYDMTAAVAGEFVSGIATVQSQYDPALTAHSAGNILKVNY